MPASAQAGSVCVPPSPAEQDTCTSIPCSTGSELRLCVRLAQQAQGITSCPSTPVLVQHGETMRSWCCRCRRDRATGNLYGSADKTGKYVGASSRQHSRGVCQSGAGHVVSLTALLLHFRPVLYQSDQMYNRQGLAGIHCPSAHPERTPYVIIWHAL